MAAKAPVGALQDRQEACKTFLEQTKQLITLASAFLFAPAAFVTLAKDLEQMKRVATSGYFLGAEFCFILSVVLGYVTIGTIAGTQNDGTYNVFRLATRVSSGAQFVTYVLGIVVFALLVRRFLSTA